MHLLLMLCMLLLLALGTAACGSNQANAQPPSNTAASTSPTSKPVVCGNISQFGPRPTPTTAKGDPQKVADCFWHAYQQCQAASMNLITSSVDTVQTRTFQLQKKGNACQISDKLQMTVIPRPPHVVNVYTCASVSRQATTLQFIDCQADNTITIPLTRQ